VTDVVVSMEYYHADASTVSATGKTSAGTLFLTFFHKVTSTIKCWLYDVPKAYMPIFENQKEESLTTEARRADNRGPTIEARRADKLKSSYRGVGAL